MTGRMPAAAADSMIGVVGKQNIVEMPSRFSISVIASMTFIVRPPSRTGCLSFYTYAALLDDPGRRRDIGFDERRGLVGRAAHDFHTLIEEALFDLGPRQCARDLVVQALDDRWRSAGG